jgi:26S proteasome regulatory subunit N10
MRNGDFKPTRQAAQEDAVHAIFQSKMNAHPENAVGLMTSAGKRSVAVCCAGGI